MIALDSGVQSRVYPKFMRHCSNGLKSAMQIGEAAQRATLTVDTIRFYERRALLPGDRCSAVSMDLLRSCSFPSLLFHDRVASSTLLRRFKHVDSTSYPAVTKKRAARRVLLFMFFVFNLWPFIL